MLDKVNRSALEHGTHGQGRLRFSGAGQPSSNWFLPPLEGAQTAGIRRRSLLSATRWDQVDDKLRRSNCCRTGQSGFAPTRNCLPPQSRRERAQSPDGDTPSRSRNEHIPESTTCLFSCVLYLTDEVQNRIGFQVVCGHTRPK